MSTSTNGLLYFGFTFYADDEGDPPWGDIEDDEWLCEMLGGPKSLKEEYEGNEEKYSTYWSEKRNFLKSADIEIVIHCSGNYPMYAIAIKKSVYSASRGYPENLGPDIQSNLDWVDKLRDACEKLKIEWQEPHWELASLWN